MNLAMEQLFEKENSDILIMVGHTELEEKTLILRGKDRVVKAIPEDELLPELLLKFNNISE